MEISRLEGKKISLYGEKLVDNNKRFFWKKLKYETLELWLFKQLRCSCESPPVKQICTEFQKNARSDVRRCWTHIKYIFFYAQTTWHARWDVVQTQICSFPFQTILQGDATWLLSLTFKGEQGDLLPGCWVSGWELWQTHPRQAAKHLGVTAPANVSA